MLGWERLGQGGLVIVYCGGWDGFGPWNEEGRSGERGCGEQDLVSGKKGGDFEFLSKAARCLEGGEFVDLGAGFLVNSECEVCGGVESG